MNIPAEIRFELVNGISEKDVKSNEHIIYAHLCSKGIYVGLTTDPVKRWQEHVSDAFNEGSHNYDDKFREAIRHCGQNKFKHYIVAVANFEKSAKNKEASAIKFYGKHLNTKNETENGDRDYGFRPLKNQIGTTLILKKKSREGTFYSRSDSSRKTITAEIYFESGRKRLRSISGQPFSAGLNIECSRSERAKFATGDLVRVNVALSEKNGKEYLVAGKTSPLTPVT